MRKSFCLAAILTLAFAGAAAQTVPALPPGSAATEARLMAKVGPQTRAFIRQEAGRQRGANTFSDMAVTRAVQGLGNLNGVDVEALAFLVLMDAAKSAQEDLKAILEGVKQINDAKASNRQNARNNSAKAERPRPPINRATISVVPVPKAQLDNQIDRAKQDLESLSELGEMESLRLQMAMDRMSKMMEMLSNLSKKISDTNSTITQNLK